MFLLNRRSLIVLLSVVVLACTAYGAGRYFYRTTGGFYFGGVASKMSYRSEWDIEPLSSEKRAEAAAILAQPFTYLAKGTQSYVFLSADQKYVLKFFKQKHLEPKWWMTRQHVAKRFDKREKVYSGCKLAYDDLKEETGVLYLHLNPTDYLPETVTLIDKTGRRGTINPNETAFYIQKKGTTVSQMFEQYRACNDLAGAEKTLGRLFAYMVSRAQRGILDRDPSYHNNLGFVEGVAGNLDVGNLTHDPLIKNRVEYRRRIVENTVDLRCWISKNYPELLPEFQRQIQAL